MQLIVVTMTAVAVLGMHYHTFPSATKKNKPPKDDKLVTTSVVSYDEHVITHYKKRKVIQITATTTYIPEQSPMCGQGQDCVLWPLCSNGVIQTTGADQLDLRKGDTDPPASLGYQSCGETGSVCCQIPHDQLSPTTGGVASGTFFGGGAGAGAGYGGGSFGGTTPGGGGGAGAGYGVGSAAGTSPGGGGSGGGSVTTHAPAGPPYPRCSAGLLCVMESRCNLYTGFIGPKIPLYEGQPFVQYNHCTSESLPVGICCQESPSFGSGGVGGWVSGGGSGSVSGGGGGSVSGGGGGSVSGGGGGYGGGTVGLQKSCSRHEDCVQSVQCNNGVINTDGEGLVDLRMKVDYKKCTTSENPSVEGVCCRLPDAPPVVKTCPNPAVCTENFLCDTSGHVVTTPVSGAGFATGTDCYIDHTMNRNVGVCCQPSTGPPTTPCPSTSVCIPEAFCFGEIMTREKSFTPYAPGGSWSQCLLQGLPEPGVCCNNPPPDTGPVTQQCGVSHYGTQTDGLKTKIHVSQLDKMDADFGEFPWQAILFLSNYTFKCGASIIGKRFLLTAAHCVNKKRPEEIRVRLGEWQVNTFTEPLPYFDHDVAKIVVNPNYDDSSHWNNIAIIVLKTDIELQYNINSICLPHGGPSIPAGTRCLASGWGKDSFTGTYQHILKKVDVPLVNRDQCQTLLRKTRLGKYFKLHDSYLCAGGEEGIDACVGDGGGPLICFDKTSQSYVQVGITAWGIGCGVKDVPAAYTDVSKFSSWISDVQKQGDSHGSY